MKSNLSLLCLIGLVLSWGLLSSAEAQVTEEWVARYDGPANGIDEATILAVDGNGNVYVTGYSGGIATGYDYATIKYNSAGQQQWEARYNGPGNGEDRTTGLAVDGDGNVYVTGYGWGSSTYIDYSTIKYNAAGVQQWEARYNGPANVDDRASSLAVDGNGNVYVTGHSWGLWGDPYNYTTIKYNAAGTQLWVKHYNGPGNGNDGATVVAVDGDSNVYVTGWSWGNGTNKDYATQKYNFAGDSLWMMRYNGPGNNSDSATSMVLDSDGNVYVTGGSWGSGTNMDYATIKYNSAGLQQWEARYNGPVNNMDVATSLAVDGNGNVYVTGQSFGSGTATDYTTIKYNSAGQEQWVMRYNGPGGSYDVAYSLAVDGSGNVYVTGYSYTGSGTNFDYATIKYNAAGQQQWLVRYNGPINGSDAAYDLAVDGNDNVYVTGGSSGSGTSSDYATIKYSQSQTVDPWQVEIPYEFALIGASPNPFNPSTAIHYKLPAVSHVKLTIWDTAGRLIATLVDERQTAGTHEAVFNGAELASGIYLAKLEAGEFTAAQKLVLLK